MKSLLLLFILGAFVSTEACQAVTPLPTPPTVPVAGESIPFETIELGQPVAHEKIWTDPNPGLLVVATPDDIEFASQYVSEEAVSQLEQMDFTEFFALIVFNGWEPTVRYDFEVLHISRKNRRVSLFTESGRRSGDSAVSSPYHLIRIHKVGSWRETFVFELYFDSVQSEPISVSKFVP